MNKTNVNSDIEFYKLQASICKTFTSPARLMIIAQLQAGEKIVSEIEKATGIKQAAISQNLAVLRERGIVETDRKGKCVFYKISNPKIVKACQLMKEVLMESIKKKALLLSDRG